MIFFHGVSLQCINQAALQYHVPAAIILSVIKTENGHNGLAIKNSNGTYDLGIMQINSCWLPTLVRYGLNRKNLQFNACLNIKVGTWILAQGIAKGEGWRGIGNYHSFTPVYNQSYRQKVKAVYLRYQHFLQERV